MNQRRFLSTSGVSRVDRGWFTDPPENGSKTRRTGAKVISLANIAYAEEVEETILVSDSGVATGGPIASGRYRY